MVVPLESKLAGLIDYLAGSTFSLSGESTEIGKGVFLLAPPSFSITRMMAHA
ncbi:cell division protein SepF (plasmid) [Acaryochloris sp. 'Moss Beach']|nr:cell division protein SepF [Acaryochloris sp. 'Moss Beach']